MENGDNLTIIAHPDIFANKYGKLPGESARYIGIPVSREIIERRHTLRLSRDSEIVCESIITTGEIPMQTPYESIDSMLYVRTDGRDIPDTLADDLALILKTQKGVVVVLGCTHRGLINTLLRIRELTGTDNIYAIIGGLHLETASAERIEKTIESLKKLKIQKFGVSHCTGFLATTKLFSVFGEKVFLNKVGTVFAVP
jgi:7,8-dihydropterin-6-yl-methyl-4-(beta-D-ribofuranosyl)aminobenzene 5'-phosphate synthase